MSLIKCFDDETIKNIKEQRKICIVCLIEKPLSEFNSHSRNYDGKNSSCKLCHREANRILRKLKKTAPTIPPKCDLCGIECSPQKLQLDHDHETGLFRGWLCNKCNSALGHLGDNVKFVKRALKYLERTNRGYVQKLTSFSPLYKILSTNKRKRK